MACVGAPDVDESLQNAEQGADRVVVLKPRVNTCHSAALSIRSIALTAGQEGGTLQAGQNGKGSSNGAHASLVSEDDAPSLYFAARMNDVHVVRRLCEARAGLNAPTKCGSTPLLAASQRGHLQTVQCLCEAQADPTSARSDGATALLMASQNGHAEVVCCLVGARASIQQDIDGAAPLHIASQHGHVDVVRFLCDFRADVDGLKRGLATPLLIAAQHGHVDIVGFLCRADTRRALPAAERSVNVATPDGCTPLIAAARFDHAAVCRDLLAFRADASSVVQGNSIIGSDGTAFDVARRNGHASVIKLLTSPRNGTESL